MQSDQDLHYLHAESLDTVQRPWLVLKALSRLVADILEKYYFHRKSLAFQVNLLLAEQFTWNVKPYFFFFFWKVHRKMWSVAVVISALTLKAPITTAFFFFFYFSEKTSLEVSCESSAWQTIHMKCQDLFSLKNIKKIECRLLQILLGTLRVKG